ncbi:MAG TPA: 4Fe-4S binding protein, partial [bacterium]|nr:4Fe-4S binding protein [bacterium]
MKMNRRFFLKIAAATASAGLLSRSQKVLAATPRPRAGDSLGMLVDTTRCIGCRACEAACSEVNYLPEPVHLGDPSVFEATRRT